MSGCLALSHTQFDRLVMIVMAEISPALLFLVNRTVDGYGLRSLKKDLPAHLLFFEVCLEELPVNV